MATPTAFSVPKIASVMAGFCVREMNAVVEFYTTKLGFRVVFENPAGYVTLSRDDIEISLARDRSGARSGKGGCYFKVSGVDAFYEEFVREGVETTHPLKTETYGMREFMIADPDGNTLNFGEPTDVSGRIS